MTERKYSVSEIDRLRAACEHRWLGGPKYRQMADLTNFSWSSRCYTSGDKDIAVEQMVRTYLLAGIDPEDLENEVYGVAPEKGERA